MKHPTRSYCLTACLIIVAGAIRLHAAEAVGSTNTLVKTVVPATKMMKAPERRVGEDAPKLLEAGIPAPDFQFKTPSGNVARLSDYRGRIVVLDFWATWCGPCLRAMPHMQTLAKELKSQNVVVLAICASDSFAKFQPWVHTESAKFSDITFGCDLYDRGSSDFDKRASATYGVSGIPTQFVIAGDGEIVGSTVGFSPEGKALVELLVKAGAKPSESK